MSYVSWLTPTRTLALSEGREFDKAIYRPTCALSEDSRLPGDMYIYILGHIWDGFMGTIEMEVEVEGV